MPALSELLQASARLHEGRPCPRQVPGVRMSLLAGTLLGLEVPQRDKRFLVIVETYGCAADGIAVGANCWVGRRTMRIVDLGKVAATYVDTHSGTAVRLHPHPVARERAAACAPEAPSRWHAQLLGYQRMPDEELLAWTWVELAIPLPVLLARAGGRVHCWRCGEEVLDQREVWIEGKPVCRSCAGEAYYWIREPGARADRPAALTQRA
ncbi:FmdE family protein [Thermomicrobium sp. 4228-Ro]|uniref:FmdE family protein n=1 Tax=Thermomicrobium sp. 4228-Ro TaxID=2993937 RepID=UPI0022496457|nr:FmdE family protein [Thermomicrobium sp. 4228-Ro]MCX2726378.1 FmdE family protein [Thermomicrobium sp. 4228-Ro]